MKKKSILKRKLIRAYNNADNKRWSLRKGYPEGTYFGYSSLKEYVKDITGSYVGFYGNNLRKWMYI